ncbi:hypothetical protein HXX76_002564 [Chlamydomonas incerta]|uniref:Glycosyltransferase family 92 protein n=1 Tax=Chlamydomonas incerta TaxID=51695 RepID=A0A835TC98_CHLIN|nr:hypothetical protein HXX76_002564 [Chlamydomonas incerta]|eukprot:KAG2442478.1 hypothetical protein HXX76_002564 [Chlamydomonas incerta]
MPDTAWAHRLLKGKCGSAGQRARRHAGVQPARTYRAFNSLLHALLACLATAACTAASADSSTAWATAHHGHLHHRASAMGVTSCWLPGRLPLRPTGNATGLPVPTPVMLHVMLSTCHVPAPPLRGPSSAAGGPAPGRAGRTRLRVRGFVCVTREPQEDRCPTCHSYCLHNPFAAAMEAPAAAAGAAESGDAGAGAAEEEEAAGSAGDPQPQQPPLFQLRSPHTGRVYRLDLSDEEEGLMQSGTPEDGGGLRGEFDLADDADAAWQEFELHVTGFPYYCLVLPYTPPPALYGQRHAQHQHLGAAAAAGVGAVCGSPPLPPHGSAAAAAGAAAGPASQPAALPPTSQPPAYFVLAPRHGLSPDALASVLVPHVAWHAQLGFTQYLLYTEEPPARLAAQPALRALLLARVLVLVLWDLTPPYSGALPVGEALRREQPGSLRRAYWHQMRSYDHALLTHWHEAGAVMAFADLDEYLITPGPTTVADLFRTCGRQPTRAKREGEGEGQGEDAPGSDPLGALRLPRMDGGCSSCRNTVTGANTEPQHWAAWWAQHAAAVTAAALAAAQTAATSGAIATAAGTATATGAGTGSGTGSGSGGASPLLGWAHPLAAYDTWGQSELPDMWDQKSVVLTEAAGFTSVHSPFVYPGYGAYGPIYEDVPGACAVWLHITNQAKVRVEALPSDTPLPPGYTWPLGRIAAAAGGGSGAAGARARAGAGQRRRSALEAGAHRVGA